MTLKLKILCWVLLFFQYPLCGLSTQLVRYACSGESGRHESCLSLQHFASLNFAGKPGSIFYYIRYGLRNQVPFHSSWLGDLDRTPNFSGPCSPPRTSPLHPPSNTKVCSRSALHSLGHLRVTWGVYGRPMASYTTGLGNWLLVGAGGQAGGVGDGPGMWI